MHGRSLLPLLEGKTPADWRTKFVYEAPQSQLGSQPLWAVRTQDQKFIEYPGESFQEFYDLKSDPDERHNLPPSSQTKSFQKTISDHKAQITLSK